MKANLNRASYLLAITAVLGVGGCTGMSQQDQNTLAGAGLGGVAGNFLTDGSAIGTIGGAAAGGLLGRTLLPNDNASGHNQYNNGYGNGYNQGYNSGQGYNRGQGYNGGDYQYSNNAYNTGRANNSGNPGNTRDGYHYRQRPTRTADDGRAGKGWYGN